MGQSNQRINKGIVAVGLLLAGNGILLALSPGRFAALRQSGMMPDRYNASLDQLAVASANGRAIGTTAVLTGTALIAFGMKRTRPLA